MTKKPEKNGSGSVGRRQGIALFVDADVYKRQGYDSDKAIGCITASSTLAMLIPPGIAMILYGVSSGASVGKLFMSGLSVGVVVAIVFSRYGGVDAIKNKIPRQKPATFREVLDATKKAIWARCLPLIILLGIYAGLVAAFIFGCTLVFTIPVGIGMIPMGDRPLFARGIMLGLSAMPGGLVVGGLLCGLPVLVCLHQNLPIFALALLLLLGLWKFPHRMVTGFILLSEGIRWLVTIGLVLAAVEYMTGWCPLPGMAPLEDALATVSSIGIVLLGSLPMAELVRRLLVRPFAWLGERLGLKPQSLTGMLVGLVSALPTLSLIHISTTRLSPVSLAKLVEKETSVVFAKPQLKLLSMVTSQPPPPRRVSASYSKVMLALNPTLLL